MSDPLPTFTPEAIRRRYVEATLEVERIQALAKPHRDERDGIVAQMHPLIEREREIIATYLEIEKPLYDLQMERAALNRAMGSAERQLAEEELQAARAAAQSQG